MHPLNHLAVNHVLNAEHGVLTLPRQHGVQRELLQDPSRQRTRVPRGHYDGWRVMTPRWVGTRVEPVPLDKLVILWDLDGEERDAVLGGQEVVAL